MSQERLLCWFSCGAASAYATYLAVKDAQFKSHDVVVAYCRVQEEHEDNLRFLSEFEHVANVPVEILENEKYNGSVYDVIYSQKFIKGPMGAPCTKMLKKNVRKKFQREGDIQVFGYTMEEEHRANRFIDSNNDVETYFPLIEKGVTKRECLEFVQDMGMKMPTMYRLGYANNNCIGCVKGGMGYWNAIRVDFPEAFDRMAKTERDIGHAINKDEQGPVYLDELDPLRGDFKRDMPGDCGFTCEWNQRSLFMASREEE
jgi:3'-phosphoadenosine 5'-phosphosulfate sulfotransferase (PAPS reductase)/FAD synthetase